MYNEKRRKYYLLKGIESGGLMLFATVTVGIVLDVDARTDMIPMYLASVGCVGAVHGVCACALMTYGWRR